MEDKYIYVLTGLVILSLAINAGFIVGFFRAKGMAVDSLKDAEKELEGIKDRKLEFSYDVNKTVAVPIDTTVESPFENGITVPLETTVSVPFSENVVVPLETTAEVPLSTTATVPIDTTVEVPIEENVHTTVTINGREKEIVVPIDTTTTVNVRDEAEVTIDTVENVRVEEEVNVPIDTTENIAIDKMVSAPLTGYENLKIDKDLSVPINLDITIEKSLKELGLGGLIENLQRRIRNMRRTLQNTP